MVIVGKRPDSGRNGDCFDAQHVALVGFKTPIYRIRQTTTSVRF